MKFSRFTFIALVAMSFAAAAFAQSDTQKAFDRMKTLEGTWEGKLTTTPKDPEFDGTTMHVSFRVTSRGHALMHEMRSEGQPDDPITMFYLDGDQFLLTHYCDAGNRPRMKGAMSPDGKTIGFEFVDVSGGTAHGHMHRAKFDILDATHHVEEWTYMAGDQAIVAHVELQRTK